MPLNIPRPPRDLPPELQNWANALAFELERYGRETATSWATTDTTNASNLSSGTVASARVSGSYTGITAVGTLIAGIWNGTKIALAFGGSNADLSATGGTSQVVKQTSAGAAFTVGQLAASDLSDTTSATSWTPTDQSGAALVFTSVSARYSKIGNLVYAYGTLTYPVTANGSPAKISLPVAVANVAYAQTPTAIYTTANTINTPVIVPIQGTSQALIVDATSGGLASNANLSASLINFMAIYPAS